MTIFESILALLQLLIQYYKLKNQTVFFDLTSQFDLKLDALDKKRQDLRSKPDSKSQQEADDVMDEILEIQKQKKLFLDDWKERTPSK